MNIMADTITLGRARGARADAYRAGNRIIDREPGTVLPCWPS